METKTDLQVIKDAITLVEADGGWCQHTYCRNREGDMVVRRHDPDSSGWLASRTLSTFAELYESSPPVSFCLEGAIRMASGLYALSADESFKALGQCARLEDLVYQHVEIRAYGSVHGFNDQETTTQEDAVLVLKKTLATLEERQCDE